MRRLSESISGRRGKLLRLENVFFSYGEVPILHGISLKVSEGEIVSLIGGNGTGKTTILMAISGLYPIRSGRIEFLEKEIQGLPFHRIVSMGLSQVPEGRQLFPQMTVYENLELGAYALPQGTQEKKKEIERILGYFPLLSTRIGQMAGTLSGGEQQVLAIGRALMSQPRLLMLDEPSLGLAPLIVKEIFRIVQELNASGVTILLVEQNIRLSLTVSNRGYVLVNGRVVLEGDSKIILTDEKVIKKAYLGM
jgi:branched-chain amino acid transport system ATP-binding protein